MAAPTDQLPVRYQVERAEHQSRLLGLPLGIGLVIRAILAIPHLLIVWILSYVLGLVYLIASFAILFTGRFPQGMFNFLVGYLRWATNVGGYLLMLYDRYPPFAMSPQPDYPAQLSIDYPARSSRLLNFPLLGLVIKAVLLIPHIIILYVLALVMYVIIIIAPFAILFTGRYPAGMHSFSVGLFRWYLRLTAYIYGLTDRYPPFRMSA
jgi:hypothetical protein